MQNGPVDTEAQIRKIYLTNRGYTEIEIEIYTEVMGLELAKNFRGACQKRQEKGISLQEYQKFVKEIKFGIPVYKAFLTDPINKDECSLEIEYFQKKGYELKDILVFCWFVKLDVKGKQDIVTMAYTVAEEEVRKKSDAFMAEYYTGFQDFVRLGRVNKLRSILDFNKTAKDLTPEVAANIEAVMVESMKRQSESFLRQYAICNTLMKNARNIRVGHNEDNKEQPKLKKR